ncbi:MAG TPA: SDR family NAD(P)-dependent oxidoreductase, partial [Blastocatellia bacterium]
MDLTNKRVIVTGASSGIGRATARLFLSKGARVALIGRDRPSLESAGAGFLERGRAFAVGADLSEEHQTESALDKATEMVEGIDILVNAAGILKSGDVEKTSLDLWDETMNINLRSVFHIMKLAVPHLERSRGNIVNVSSVTGLRAFPGVLAYCVSKAAVDQLTRCAALELAPKGIRVNAVNPGV